MSFFASNENSNQFDQFSPFLSTSQSASRAKDARMFCTDQHVKTYGTIKTLKFVEKFGHLSTVHNGRSQNSELSHEYVCPLFKRDFQQKCFVGRITKPFQLSFRSLHLGDRTVKAFSQTIRVMDRMVRDGQSKWMLPLSSLGRKQAYSPSTLIMLLASSSYYCLLVIVI